MEPYTGQPFRTDLLISRARIAASLGEFERAVALLQDAFRAGFTWRSVLHTLPGLDPLRGYAPYEELIRPR